MCKCSVMEGGSQCNRWGKDDTDSEVVRKR